jgi:anti-anti-sigma factor
MQLATEIFGAVMVVHTPEELTSDTTSSFLDALTQPIEQGRTQLVLEMEHTEGFDSEGLESLLDLQDKLRDLKGNVKICGLGDPGRKIFELTRLDRRFDIFDSVIDAVASFQ